MVIFSAALPILYCTVFPQVPPGSRAGTAKNMDGTEMRLMNPPAKAHRFDFSATGGRSIQHDISWNKGTEGGRKKQRQERGHDSIDSKDVAQPSDAPPIICSQRRAANQASHGPSSVAAPKSAKLDEGLGTSMLLYE